MGGRGNKTPITPTKAAGTARSSAASPVQTPTAKKAKGSACPPAQSNPAVKQRDLTLKQRKWLKTYLRTGNATLAARKHYDCSTDDVAEDIGRENLRKLREHIHRWLEDHGLSDDQLDKDLIAALRARETKTFLNKDTGEIVYSRPLIAWGPRLAALQLANKLKGRLVDKSEVKFVEQLTDEEINARLARLVEAASGATP